MSYNIEQIRKTLNLSGSAELRRYLANEILDLDTVQDLKGSPSEIGLEALAKQMAVEKLVKILKDLEIWNELPKTEKEIKENKDKDNFGVKKPYGRHIT